ncbi:hypothetical protein SNEBB_010457 [Seison nebaliae]|nr:hypothetical protein SNEBB_010457 [Seison nebaliae]
MDGESAERAFLGFKLLITISCSLIIFILWKFVSDETLNSYQIYYIPDRYWYYVISILILSLPFLIILYSSFMQYYLLPPFNDIRNIIDEHTISQHSAKNNVYDISVFQINLEMDGIVDYVEENY